MKLYGKMFVPLVALVLLVSTSAQAQRESPWTFEVLGAYVLPGGDLADVAKGGFGFGGGLGYFFTPSFGLWLNANWAKLGGKTEGSTELPYWNTHSGFLLAGYDLLAQEQIDLIGLIGAGVLRYRPDVGATPSGGAASWTTDFAINGGVKLYVWASPSFGVMAGGNFVYAFTSTEEGQTESASVFTIPFTAGLVVKF